MAENPLDMALEEVISKSRTGRDNNRNGHRGSNRTGDRGRDRERNTRYRDNNSSPYSRSRGPPTPPVLNKLVVANLHYDVNENDLYELFGQIGPLKRAFLRLDSDGKSSGVADVDFVNRGDSERAMTAYNNVELDGRPMRITFGSIVRQQVRGNIGGQRPRDTGRSNNYGRRNETNQNQRRRQEPRSKPSEADLDAEMDNYMSSAVVAEDTEMA
ncbi:hypothetical protein CLU79DRAFT_737335 [Phycomyces nitens]|nr:hypothetical protein CLU79DRAFT_737335 [Phycomyces nitens]